MVNVAIVGVGNCACSLVQSIELAKKGMLQFVSQLPEVKGIELGSLNVVAAFDVNARKVGLDLAEAIFAEPNCTTAYARPTTTGVTVSPGPVGDGVDGPLAELIPIAQACSAADIDSVVQTLRSSAAQIVVLYLPVGAQEASEQYAHAALLASCALVNCTPAALASSRVWQARFAEAGLPLVGDDMKSHIGSTAVHQALLGLMKARGLQVENTYQLNVGGNTDFLNMRDPKRSSSKRQSKVTALSSFIEAQSAVGIGPSDFVPFLHDRKVGYIRIEGRGFLGMPISLEVRLSVEDSPNAAPVALDAIRLAAALRSGQALDEDLLLPRLFKRPVSSGNQ